jgi:cytochrome c553
MGDTDMHRVGRRRRWPWVLLVVLAAGPLLFGVAVWLSDAPGHQPRPDAWSAGGASGSVGANVFESCASCHLSQAQGRSDGSIPRLAGQLPEIVVGKLASIREGHTYLPVMKAFAVALSKEETDSVAAFIASRPEPTDIGHGDGEQLAMGGAVYANMCQACHGATAMGQLELGAPRLCGQHHGYLLRRLDEAEGNLRGDASAAMVAVVDVLTSQQRYAVTDYLSRCEP